MIISIQTGTNLLGAESNHGTPLIKMGNIQRGFFSFKKVEFLNENEQVEEKNMINFGDFLFNTRNTLDLVGKGATWFGKNDEYAFNSNIARFTFEGINTIFFNYLYNTSQMIKQVQARAVGTTSVAAVYPKDLNSIKFWIPSANEQQKIGALFKQIDDTITLHQRNVALLKRLKEAYLKRMLPQNSENKPLLRSADFSDPWEQRELGEHAQVLTGGTPKTQIKEFWEPKEIPWMSSGEINKKRLFSTDNQISKLGFESSSARWVKVNSVLIALAGQGKTRGTVAINEIPLTTNQSIAAIEPDDSLDSEFLFQNLENRYEELRLASSGDGSRGGLNKQIISDIKIIAPSIQEQRKVGSFFKQLDDTIALHQSKLEKLKDLKQVLLAKMFV